MRKTIKIIDPSKDERWDYYILNHGYGSIYHHSLWKEVVQKSYGYKPIYIILEDECNNIVGGIPFFLIKSYITGTRLVSLSFSDHSEILLNYIKDKEILLRAIKEQSYLLGASTIEIKLKKSIEYLENTSYIKKAVHKNHILVLNEPLESLKHRFHSTISRNIKKAQKSDLIIHFGKKENDMKSFYDLYVMSRKFHGLPPQPYAFFKNMWNILYPNNFLYVLLALDNDKPISGIILTKFKNTMYYLYGGSNRKYLGKRPNHLLFWKGIELAIHHGLDHFDFGRTSLDNQGLLTFKRRWGTSEYDVIHFCYGSINKDYLLLNRRKSTNNISHKLCKSLPKYILKIGGKIIYKHLG